MSARNLVVSQDGVVVDVVMGDAHLDGYSAGATLVPLIDALAFQGVWIGWKRQAGGTFVAPGPSNTTLVTAVAKIEFYRRCTDQEVGQIQALLAETGPKMSAIFDACMYFRSDAPEWPMLLDATVGLFGAERAAVLLAPSE